MSRLVQSAKEFRTVLDAARKCATSASFDWYPYNSLSTIQHLENFLEREYVMQAARANGILDLGAGDGDLSFFFESQGCAVTAVDHAASNQNGMEGLRALHRELGSKIEIRDVDADSEIPQDGRYGLTLCMGLLYHLKNPFFVLERLAKISEYCILSTRIARRLPDGSAMPGNHALAYLVGEEELNNDDTNFWIFSEAGLRRLLERTRWQTLGYFTTGDTVASDPVHADRDERAFCLLQSHYGCQHLELMEGWHPVEESGWRWTEGQFAARATSRSGMKHAKVAMRLFVPPVLIEKFGSITLAAKIDDAEAEPMMLRRPGIHEFERKIAKAAESSTVVFRLDHVLRAGEGDSRELGIIVASLEFL